MDEDFRVRLKPEDRRADELRSWRGFGVGLGILLLLGAWRSWRRGGGEAAWIVTAFISIAAALAHPASFRWPYRLWMPLARVLARVNTWIVCSLFYYVVLTPYAVLARALGARFLETELKAKDSYWNIKPKRDPAESARRSF